MNKKGADTVTYHVIFIILNLTFILIMLGAIYLTGGGGEEGFKNQVLARNIALMIDSAKPGTEITLSLAEHQLRAKEEGFEGDIVKIDTDGKRVIVQTNPNAGTSFSYFSNAEVSLETQKGGIGIKIKIG